MLQNQKTSLILNLSENYKFLKININNAKDVDDVFKKYEISHVIHLAAESHVDRSIDNSIDFALTNVIGTVNLLNAAKNNWIEKEIIYFITFLLTKCTDRWA